MIPTLAERTVAFLVANDGVEQIELTHPWRMVRAAGGRAVLVAPDSGPAEFDARGAVIAAICHGPWTLIDAGSVEGRTLAAWPSLATDLVNTGATWTADRTQVDGALRTAQSDEDVDAFTAMLLGALVGAP